jgi:OOP family OmpA-OmpF porin
VAGDRGGLRAELRGEDWIGDEGLSGADVFNAQLVLGYSFGFRAEEGPGDSDGDGVTDDKDRCPNTPAGAIVDANGCPLDSDGDGVYDGIDQCPNTPRGTEVDKRGCPIKKALFEPGKEKLLLEGVNFAFNSDVLTPESHEILDKVAGSLQDWPEVRVRVEGYTDSIGDDEYNLGLSDRRANSVRSYLISKGVAEGRLEAKGFGEADPIASNETEAGRAQNRRVELRQLR